MMAFLKFGLYYKAKIQFFRFHLQNGRSIISKMVVRSLP